MSMQRCLVILNREDQVKVLLDMAAHLVSKINLRRIDVLALREPSGTGQPFGLTAEGVFLLEEDQKEWALSLHKAFCHWLQNEYIQPHDMLETTEINWLDPEGEAASVIPMMGRNADLIITLFPDKQDSQQKQRGLKAAIFETDRPVLLVPPYWDRGTGESVLLAWKDAGCARRAFASARHILPAAQTVQVLMQKGEHWPQDILPEVTLHKIALPAQHSPAEVGQAILDTAMIQEADLIVMGGYQHGLLYNRIMGSATDYILQHPLVPVLLQY